MSQGQQRKINVDKWLLRAGGTHSVRHKCHFILGKVILRCRNVGVEKFDAICKGIKSLDEYVYVIKCPMETFKGLSNKNFNLQEVFA